jgi:hypothetical protein
MKEKRHAGSYALPHMAFKYFLTINLTLLLFLGLTGSSIAGIKPPFTVSGTITGADGKPLAGVSVQ